MNRGPPCAPGAGSHRCPHRVGRTDKGHQPLLGGRGAESALEAVVRSWRSEVLEEEWTLAGLTVDWKEGCCW